MELDLHTVRQINGDMRIDDGDEGPMLKLEFFDVWASTLTDDEKADVMGAVIERLGAIFEARNAG